MHRVEDDHRILVPERYLLVGKHNFGVSVPLTRPIPA